LRYELRATWLGGARILQKTRDVHYDVFRHRPTLGGADAIVIAWKALTWPATPRSTTPS
jgi:hypothetical protein